jgi:hypothetical protein
MCNHSRFDIPDALVGGAICRDGRWLSIPVISAVAGASGNLKKKHAKTRFHIVCGYCGHPAGLYHSSWVMKETATRAAG